MKTQHTEERKRVRQGLTDVFPVSISRVQRYDRCPRWFDYESNQRLPRTQTDAADLGESCHQYVKSKIEGSPIELDIPMQSYEEFYKLQKLLDDLAADHSHLAALEETINFSWEDDGALVEMECRIDRLDLLPDGSAIVTDYKTGWYLPDNLDEDMQGLAYCLAIHKSYPEVWKFVFRQVQVRFARILEIEYSLEDVERFYRALQDRAHVMRKDSEFRPKPGDHCRLCPYSASHCDVGAKLLGRQKPLTDALGAVEEGEAIAHLEAVIKRRKDALRAFVVQHGPVELPGGDRWTFVKRTAMRIPEERLEQAASILEESGYKSEEFIEVKFNYISGRKLLRGKHAIPALQDIVVDRPYTTFALDRKDKKTR